jgi:hypothetical protein
LSAIWRPFGAFDRVRAQFSVRNEIEYGLQKRRAQLNDTWVNDDPALLRDVSRVAVSLFSSWVSENVARRFALDPREQLDLAILAAIHYLSLFLDDEALDAGARTKMALQVSRALRCPAAQVLTLLEKQPNLSPGIAALCDAATDATGSARLQQFNPGILISIVKGTSFGINAVEMLAVALEHPPPGSRCWPLLTSSAPCAIRAWRGWWSTRPTRSPTSSSCERCPILPRWPSARRTDERAEPR